MARVSPEDGRDKMAKREETEEKTAKQKGIEDQDKLSLFLELQDVVPRQEKVAEEL